MDKNLKLAVICSFTFAMSMFIFAWQKEYIIFRFKSLSYQGNSSASHEKKTVNLFYWVHDRWNKEETNIIWSNNIAESIGAIVKSWLILIEEEKLINKKITLLSSLLGPNKNELYLSFDRNLIDDEESTISKLMLIESLLKTLRENSNQITKVRLLKHHQTIWDNHLDLYHSWPIEGFLS
jgi:hypothetical protein